MIKLSDERKTKYIDLLKSIYGKILVKKLLNLDKNNSLMFKSNVDETIKSFDRKIDQGFVTFKGIYEAGIPTDDSSFPSWNDRKMDFPSWQNKLIFKNSQPAKNIVIVGLEPGPKVGKIGVTYGFGRETIREDTISGLKDTGERTFWNYFLELFEDKFESFCNTLYITDISKVYTGFERGMKKKEEIKKSGKKGNIKQNKIWKKCIKEFFIPEIQLIRPKLVIFNGSSVVNYIKRSVRQKLGAFAINPIGYFEIDHDNEDIKLPKFDLCGKWIVDDTLTVIYIVVYHPAYTWGTKESRIIARKGFQKIIRHFWSKLDLDK